MARAAGWTLFLMFALVSGFVGCARTGGSIVPQPQTLTPGSFGRQGLFSTDSNPTGTGLHLRVKTVADFLSSNAGPHAAASVAPSPGASPSTFDRCPSGYTCQIQTLNIVISVTWVPTDGKCDENVAMNFASPPPGVTYAASQNPIPSCQPWTFTIATTSTAHPGLPESVTINGSASDGDVVNPDTINYYVLCDVALNSCPNIEAVDTTTGNVFSTPGHGPPPTPGITSVIGKRQSWLMQPMPGSGANGPYTMSNPQWPDPGTAEWVKSYDLLAGGLPVEMNSADFRSPALVFYPFAAGLDGPITATLTSASGMEIADSYATFSYAVSVPTNSSMSSTTNSVQVGNYDGANIALSLGTRLSEYGSKKSGASEGIAYAFSAQAPSNSGGYFAVVQLINHSETDALTPGASPAPTPMAPPPGVFWLDGCVFLNYNLTPNGNVYAAAGQKVTFQAFDSPATLLDITETAVTRSDQFDDWFMFKGAGTDTIWVPIGEISASPPPSPSRIPTTWTPAPWAWGGKTTRSGSPTANGGWVAPTAVTQPVNPPGYVFQGFKSRSLDTNNLDSRNFYTPAPVPTWSNIFAPQGARCPSPPPS